MTVWKPGFWGHGREISVDSGYLYSTITIYSVRRNPRLTLLLVVLELRVSETLSRAVCVSGIVARPTGRHRASAEPVLWEQRERLESLAMIYKRCSTGVTVRGVDLACLSRPAWPAQGHG